jgi:hypothetical protein
LEVDSFYVPVPAVRYRYPSANMCNMVVSLYVYAGFVRAEKRKKNVFAQTKNVFKDIFFLMMKL